MIRQQLSPLTQNKLESSSLRKLQQFFVEVVLGRASADCKYLGICKIETISIKDVLEKLVRPTICGKAVYALASYQPNAFLELTFLQASLDTTTRNRHFDNNSFIVEEPYKVQTKTMQQAFTIKTSVYPIVQSDTLIIVRFENENL